MNTPKKQLMDAVPYMRCGNNLEFKQRLQWLSEGMLRNHIESIVNYTIDQTEIDQYHAYKNATKKVDTVIEK